MDLVTAERRAKLRALLATVAAARPQVFRALSVAGSFALIVAGVWGRWGWTWAAIAAGAPGFGFYLWGEIRRTLTHQRMEDR